MMLILGLALISVLVSYYSWLPSPNLRNEQYLPAWLSTWADAHWNMRTAVPFLLGGVLVGLLGEIKHIFKFIIQWLLFFTLLVVLAEVGQIWLPNRSFDTHDIAYGIMGAALGLIPCTVFRVLRRNNFSNSKMA